ncbi:MAG: SDR family NAD(P)-dependent oxidoreductase [Bacteroidota bacterium]
MFILITGSANGIGKAIAEAFLQHGDQVIGCDIASQHTIQHVNYYPILMDVSSDESVEQAVQVVLDLTDQLDVIIHNAGITDYFPLSDTPTAKLRHINNINAWGLHRLVHHFWKHLPKGNGKVISISSESVHFPGPFQPYQISKITLEALHESLRHEMGLVDRKMVIIRPGAMQTALMEQLYDIHLPEGPFKKYLQRFATTATEYTGTIRPPEKLAQKVLQVALTKHPKKVYHFYNNPLLKVLGWLPPRLKDYFMRKSLMD